MARKHKHLKKLQKKFDNAVKSSKTLHLSNAGVKYDKKAITQYKKVNGETVEKQAVRGKQKAYHCSKSLI